MDCFSLLKPELEKDTTELHIPLTIIKNFINEEIKSLIYLPVSMAASVSLSSVLLADGDKTSASVVEFCFAAYMY